MPVRSWPTGCRPTGSCEPGRAARFPRARKAMRRGLGRGGLGSRRGRPCAPRVARSCPTAAEGPGPSEGEADDEAGGHQDDVEHAVERHPRPHRERDAQEQPEQDSRDDAENRMTLRTCHVRLRMPVPMCPEAGAAPLPGAAPDHGLMSSYASFDFRNPAASMPTAKIALPPIPAHAIGFFVLLPATST